MFVSRGLGLLAALAVSVTAQIRTTDIGSSGTPTTLLSQTSSSQRVSTSTSSRPATITIAVGANGHVFTPHEAKANVGDIIKFNFYPSNHRAVRAEFGWPCIPYEYANVNKAGFDSGTFTPQVVSSNPPSYSVRVNDTDPIFFYCAAPNSCVPNHMIGVINPNATHTYDAQLAFALNATYQLAPGEPFPSEMPKPNPSTSAGGSAPGPTSSSSSDSSSNNSEGAGGGGLSSGAIAGIAIGGAAVLILAAALIYLCGRRGGFDKAYRKSTAVPTTGTGVGAGPGHGSPAMVEAQYANSGLVGGYGGPKSPGQATLSTFAGHDNGTLRGSVFGGGGGGVSPGVGTTPSPGPGGLPGYGFGAAVPGQHGVGHDPFFGSLQSSPRADHQFTPYVPPPVELPTGEAPVPTQSPPPGYQGRNSWVQGLEGAHKPGGNP